MVIHCFHLSSVALNGLIRNAIEVGRGKGCLGRYLVCKKMTNHRQPFSNTRLGKRQPFYSAYPLGLFQRSSRNFCCNQLQTRRQGQKLTPSHHRI